VKKFNKHLFLYSM